VKAIYLLIIPLLFLELAWGPAGFDPAIVEAVRLPRALGAVAAGAALAISGHLLQTALRNPLADPYLLGVSQTALFTALLSYVLWRLFSAPYLGYLAGSLLGAAAATAVLLYAARRAPLTVVVLFGVLLAFAASSATQLLLLALPPEELGYIYLSLQGTFAAYPPGPVGYAAAAAVAAIYAAAWARARRIAAYIHGEEAAKGLGVDVEKTNLLIAAAGAAAAGVATATVGPVGFIGLLAPHMAKWAEKSVRFDKTLHAAAAMGVALALAADNAIRLLLPRDVPATVVLSIVGAPAAAWLLLKYVRGL